MNKKYFILAIMLVSAMVINAQNVKRVAILETVDKYDKVDYGVKLQIRAIITKAVNDTPGFEGYDRTDMSLVIKEHDFQRTGMVSDSDIKKLGEMTGASSIMVSEAAAYGSDGRIIITAKLINIETGRIEISATPRVAKIEGKEMELACRDMFYELMGSDIKDMEVEELRNQLRESRMRESKLLNRISELEYKLSEKY